jgi:Na+-transporting methylmalonyl-CoA/oxaloacetate decarboxylase gamma subunit
VNPFTHGLILTVLGMGLVFMALAIFLLSMVSLTWLFSERETGLCVATAGVTGRIAPSGPSEAEMAAIGAALAVWLGGPPGQGFDPQLGATLASSPSPWGVAARTAPRGL